MEMEDERILFTPFTFFMEYILRRYHEYLRNKLKGTDITPSELSYLFNIFYYKSLSQRELSDLLFVSEPNVTKMTKKLENKEYIQRDIDKANKSRKILSLTKKGELFVYKLIKLTYEWETKVSYSFNDEDMDNIKHLLYEITDNSLNDL